MPVSDDPDDGTLRTADGITAYVFKPVTGLRRRQPTPSPTPTPAPSTRDNGEGAFVAAGRRAAGHRLEDRRRLRELRSAPSPIPNLRGPLLSVIAWTFAFAILSVALTFGLGLFLAIIFNHDDCGARRSTGS